MTLLSLTIHPPGGFSYRDPKTGWSAPREGQPFDDVARLIQTHRQHNPTIFNADERTIQAAYKDLDAYTCRRLNCNPQWCACEGSRRTPVEEPKKGCASCGGRKKTAGVVAGGKSSGRSGKG